jgi:hypothetical protein
MRRTLAVLGGLGLALGFSQFPEYAQQYEQRLGGAVDELKSIVTDFDRDAQRFGLTRQEALQRYAVSPDDFLIARGTSMDQTLSRYDKLSGMLADLQNAGPLGRVAHLPDYLDTDVGARALQAYKPAVPVTAEGLGWGVAGWIIGYLILYPLLGLFTLPFRWRRGQSPHRRVPRPRRERRPVEVEAVSFAEIVPKRGTPRETVEVIETRVPEPVVPARRETQREIDERIVRQI